MCIGIENRDRSLLLFMVGSACIELSAGVLSWESLCNIRLHRPDVHVVFPTSCLYKCTPLNIQGHDYTYLASRAKAIAPDTIGVAALVAPKSSTQFPP